jgi:hypothetical protein
LLLSAHLAPRQTARRRGRVCGCRPRNGGSAPTARQQPVTCPRRCIRGSSGPSPLPSRAA